VILVDTSVWIDHLRSGDEALAGWLDAGLVLSHPFIVGEVALGDLRRREVVLGALSDLPRANVASDAEVLGFINRHALHGRGIGYVDAHLLAGARLTSHARIWAKDKRLHAVAAALDLAFAPPRVR
jgi:predicted nucleic acid-binding protein